MSLLRIIGAFKFYFAFDFTSSACGTFFPPKGSERLSGRRLFHLIRLRHLLLKEKGGGQYNLV